MESTATWKTEDERFAGSRLLRAELASGLTGYVAPKPGFWQKYAIFAVRYGSIDREFALPERGGATRVPDGIAHFLEHKLFEKEKGDVFADFARLGASANAYTSYGMTAYLFSTVDNFRDALEILLRFVQTPYFTEASVRKEQGIIEQELRMYEDDPGRALVVNLMQALYHLHPVRVEIGGTVESIRQIDVPALYLCHSTFYRPSNAVLVVAGDVNPVEVWELASTLVQPAGEDGRAVRRIDPGEPDAVASPRVECRLPVSRPRLALGVKDDGAGRYGRELVRRDIAISLALEAAFGRASDAFRDLYEAGLIDDDFGARYASDTRYAHTMILGETPDPDALEKRLRGILAQVTERGVDVATFERLRRKEVGEYIAAMDNPESVANVVAAMHFRGTSPAEYLDVLQELDAEQVSEMARSHFDPRRTAVSVVLPSRDRTGPAPVDGAAGGAPGGQDG